MNLKVSSMQRVRKKKFKKLAINLSTIREQAKKAVL